jgi:hypothetical protein
MKAFNAVVDTLSQPETGSRKEAQNRVSRAKERSVSPVEETRTQKPVEEHEPQKQEPKRSIKNKTKQKN